MLSDPKGELILDDEGFVKNFGGPGTTEYNCKCDESENESYKNISCPGKYYDNAVMRRSCDKLEPTCQKVSCQERNNNIKFK